MKNKYLVFYKKFLPTLLVMLFAVFNTVNAQTAKSSDYQLNPSWVQMMSDPNVNYYEAVNAYETYWKGKEMPEDEEEAMEEMAAKNHSAKMTDKERKEMEKEEREHKREMERESKKKLTEEDMKYLEWKREMAYQCKRFKDWKKTVQPFVQNDGRILNEQERMKIYDQRQKELRQK